MDALSEDWLIVGLGNPGSEYRATRHNVGFMLVDLLAERSGILIKRTECRSLIGRGTFAGERVELVKPETFMNLSGEAVKCLLRKTERSAKRMIVISDDLALPLGTIRLRPKGSHGGHNGLRSIIDQLGSGEFTRLRIGIMPDHPVRNSKNFVLEKFSKDESANVDTVLDSSVSALESVVKDGIDKAMSVWNSSLKLENAE